MRVRPPDSTWKAPLHPHTTAGELAWMAREFERILR